MSNFLIISEKKSVWYKNGTHQSDVVTKPTKKETKTRSAAKNVINVIYPIFKDMADLTDDLFWKEIFTNFSVGNCKRGFSFTSFKDDINAGLLSYKIRTKEYQCYVKNKAEIAFLEVKYFMSEYGGILSENDKLVNTGEMQSQLNIKSENSADNWSKVRNNVARKVLTTRFAKYYCQQNNIPETRYMELKKLIDFYLILGKMDIKMKDGLIVEIPSLSFTDDNFHIDIPHNKIRHKIVDDFEDDSPEVNENSNKIWYKNYIKFLDDLDKRIAKRTL
jgi:hypothetical protein